MPRPFVDRIEEMRHLKRASRYDAKEAAVLVFTGIGGMGKSALRVAFEEQVLKRNKVPYAVLDYDGDPNLRPIEATLRAIRRQLGRYGVKTPVFDYLYARYFELSTGLKLSTQNCPPELEGVVSILEGIPGVGSVAQILHGLTQLGLSAKERLEHKEWLYRIRELEPREVLNLLPEVLADDLEEVASSQSVKVLKSSGLRISLLLDAYERLSESQLDDTLHRRLLFLTSHLLRVVFTRDPLPWEHKFPKEWQGKITHFPSLEVLSREDTVAFLKEKHIESPGLQAHLYQLTGGYPFHLELCADIYREIEESTERKPGVEDFEGAAQAVDLTEELVDRLLRQLKDNERDLMGLVCYPRWVSEEVLEVLSSVPESVPRIYRKLIRLSMFSPHPEIAEAHTLRKEVRAFLITQQRQERLWKNRHGSLSGFHRGRWKETGISHHLQEALYHSFYEDSEEAMRLFEEHFWRLLDSCRFGEAEGLLEAIPPETLSEKARREVDYARARLLTATMRSQQSLITAKQLYEALVTSETDEELLSKYLFHLGDLMEKVSDYGKALDYHQKSLAIRLKVLSEEHPDVADSYNSIGVDCWRKAQYAKALEHFRKALGIWVKIYGEEHKDVANAYNNMGEAYRREGEYANALECHKKSLAIRLKVYGEEHPDVAESYNNIGLVYSEQNEYMTAIEYLGKSLSIWSEIYGEEHPEVGVAYHNTGIVWHQKGEYVKALGYFQKSLTIWLKVYGENHTDVAHSYNNIAETHCKRGELKRCLHYHKKSLGIRLKVHGEEHPDVAMSYWNIANTLRRLGSDEEAFESIRRSVDTYHRLGFWKDTVEGLDALAGWLEKKGRTKEAEKARAEAHQLREDHNVL